MWWFTRTEEPPPGLPAKTYALFRLKEGWYFLRGYPGNVPGERYREGPFPEREDARWHAWKDAGTEAFGIESTNETYSLWWF